MPIDVTEGDLLQQQVEVIVNAWNQNVLPWWLLLPQGVSGAIKRRGGLAPFQELARMGPLPLGAAVLTGPGRLPFRAIIHVAGINLLWRSSEFSVRKSVQNALRMAQEQGFASVAFPLIGAGSGSGKPADIERWMLDEMQKSGFEGQLVLVHYRPKR